MNPLPRCLFRVLPAIVLVPTLWAAVPNRILRVSDESREPIQHMVPARAAAAGDLGQASRNTTLNNVTLRFSMSTEQQAALTQLLIDQQNPSSPRYHKWLTPEQFGAQFGLSAADIAKVSSWLTSQGLTVTGQSRSATFLTVNGTVDQVEAAFQTSIHRLSENGETHISNVTDPALPSGIAAVVTGITGLNDFRLRSRARVHTANAVVHPNFTSTVSGNIYIAPGDIYTIYNINPLLTSAVNGTGQTIAIMGQTDISTADVAAFRSASGLPANVPAMKLYGTDPGTVSSDLDEAQLDVEWSGAAAPYATILYVNSNDVIGVSLTQAIDNNLAPIMSVSYGGCEKQWGTSDLNTYNLLFQQANAQGITIVGPAGDSGATDCDYNAATASQGLAVDFPASSPYVTAAGGTQFNEGAGTYRSTTTGAFSGSALSYVPETVWNETGALGTLSAGGGGVSAFFGKPVWQMGEGVPADGSRDVPDIALNSAVNHEGYLLCSSGSCTNGYRNAQGTLNVVGGTSVSTPIFAGMLALVSQKIGSRIGNANPTIYALANSKYYSQVFHDITTGNNSSPCRIRTLNCPSGGSIGYAAATGYDLATGWGSVDAFNLAQSWSLVTPASSTSAVSKTTVTANAVSITGAAPVTLAAAITSGSAMVTTAPTGTVQFLVDNAAVGSAIPLVNGTATYTLATAGLASGTHNVAAIYSGDSSYIGSKGQLNLDVVSATAADFVLTPLASAATATSGGSSTGVVFSVAPVNGFSGAITFAATNLAQNSSATFSTNPVTISSTATGTTTLTLKAFNASAVTSSGTRASVDRPRSGKHERSSALYGAGADLALASILFVGLPRRRLTSLLIALVSVGAIGLAGCSGGGQTALTTTSTTTTAPGGGTTTGATNNNTTAGTYVVLVTATSGSVTHSAQIALTVQ